jgi:hypothetical protein
MEITNEIVERMISIRKMSMLDPDCYFLVCQEQKVYTIRLEDEQAFNNKSLQDNNVGIIKQGNILPSKNNK